MRNETKKRNHPLLIILVGLVLIGLYFAYSHYRDMTVARNVYQNLVAIDLQLDQLRESATTIKEEKAITEPLINEVKELTSDNFVENKAKLLNMIRKINYDSAAESALVSIMNATTPENFHLERHEMIRELRLLKYDNSQAVAKFNDRISQITAEVSKLSAQVSQIKGSNLQNLELAKLKFISNKIATTANALQDSLLEEILDDVVDKSSASGDAATKLN